MDYQPLSADRRKQPNAPLTELEKSDYRALIGSLGWISRQTRPDIMVNVSMASQKLGAPLVKDVVELNKAVKMLKETSEAKWIFHNHQDLKLTSLVVFVCADSSFANIEKLKSQCGYVIGLSTEAIAKGERAPVHVVETHSGSIKRVCRSTLAAEANAFLMATEAGDYLRSILLEIQHPNVSIQDLEEHYVKSKMVTMTDAKSLETTLQKDAGNPADKRVKILVAQIKEKLGATDYEDDSNQTVIWVDTHQMLADVLTKLGCEREFLLEVLSSGWWQLEPSNDAKWKKQQIREGRHRRKQASKTADLQPSTENRHAAEGCETTPEA